MRVLRVYHAAQESGHDLRLASLRRHGLDVVVVAPADWGSGAAPAPRILLPTRRVGDVNRHRYASEKQLRDVMADIAPDLVDVHEEPFSVAGRQWLKAAGDVPVVMYTAQNLDKRFPPPFHQYEQAALRQVSAFYPCSRQAASVIRGKGYSGPIRVLPLGYDDSLFMPGEQSLDDDPLVLAIVGRLVPEKGVLDAVHVLRTVRQERKARLLVIGRGPEEAAARALAARYGLADDVDFRPWTTPEQLAGYYRQTHVLLVPSTSTATWVEQFGRVIVEAQASGAVVASYSTGAIPEVVDGAGILVPEGDVESLACEVTHLTQDAPWHDVLRRRGFDLAAARTWQRVAEDQVALYRDAIKGVRSEVPAGRTIAALEFGAPATSLGQERPFALPLLRQPSWTSRTVAGVFDLVSTKRR